MKQIDKKDMPKLVALIALAVGLFGYAIFAVAGASTPPPAAAAASAGKPAGSPAAGTPSQRPGSVGGGSDSSGSTTTVAALGDTDPSARPAFDPSLVGFPTGGKDPFAPVASLSKDMITAAAVPPVRPPAVVPSLTVPSSPPLPGMFEKLIAPPVKVTTARTAANAGAVLPAPPPPPSFVVTGIVMGDAGQGDNRHVAILRGTAVGGGEERRFVVGGEEVGNGFIVSAVHSYGVELKEKFGSRHVLLRLGENPADKLRSVSPTPAAAVSAPETAPQVAAPQQQSGKYQNNYSGDNARATK